jgi:hypothetical protein
MLCARGGTGGRLSAVAPGHARRSVVALRCE